MDKHTATHLPATGDLSSHTPMMQHHVRVKQLSSVKRTF